LTIEKIVAFCPDVHERQAFVCGPAGFAEDMFSLLTAAGVEEIFSDDFDS
jgi:ferredoxin-NADP reductase